MYFTLEEAFVLIALYFSREFSTSQIYSPVPSTKSKIMSNCEIEPKICFQDKLMWEKQEKRAFFQSLIYSEKNLPRGKNPYKTWSYLKAKRDEKMHVFLIFCESQVKYCHCNMCLWRWNPRIKRNLQFGRGTKICIFRMFVWWYLVRCSA